MPLYERPDECCSRCHFVATDYIDGTDYYICETGLAVAAPSQNNFEELDRLTQLIRRPHDHGTSGLSNIEFHLILEALSIPELRDTLQRYADNP